MCIRDRYYVYAENANAGMFSPQRAEHEFYTANLSPPNTNAVSYTHLRAHETVLDLVCRLLLENKNHNIYNT